MTTPGIDRMLDEIRGLPGVSVRSGATREEIEQAQDRLGRRLPAAYVALLERTNGLELQHGWSKLLGVGPRAPIDVVWWNDHDTWKWAWDWAEGFVALDDFFVLGVSAEGALNACAVDDLGHVPDPPVYVLAPLLVEPVWLGKTVSQFLNTGTRSRAQNPSGGFVARRYLERFGRIGPGELIVPSPLGFVSGETEETRDLAFDVLMPADQAMVVVADLSRQKMSLGEGDTIVEVEPYEIRDGMSSLRYVTASSG